MSGAARIFAALPGLWQLTRTIENFGTVEGQVSFTPQPDGKLLYEEHGSLRIARTQTVNDVFRSYLYALEKGRLAIYYHDPQRRGEIMHELEFAETEGAFVSRHVHACARDRYGLTFRFTPERRIVMDYRVTGPAKDYVMHSVLTLSP